MEAKRKFRLEVERGDAGLWYITSSDLRGLFIAEKTLSTALAKVAEVAVDLLTAARLAKANGQPFNHEQLENLERFIGLAEPAGDRAQTLAE